MRSKSFQILILLFCLSCDSYAQKVDSLASSLEQIPGKFYAKVEKKYSGIEKKLSRRSVKYLKKLQRQESKIQKMLKRYDSTVAGIDSSISDNYTGFIKSISAKSNATGVKLNQYSSFVDTLTTSLSFLNKYGGGMDKTAGATTALNQLKDRLNQSEKINAFINERKQQLQQMLQGYTKLPASVTKEFDKMRKTAWYYKAQIAEYKAMLKDPKKIEEKALSLLNQMPVFQKFMKENSQLATLFRIPGVSPGTQGAALTGLQTRSSVQGMIQQRIASGGPNAMAQIQQNLAAAQAQLSELKEKLLSQVPSSGGDLGEAFKPNTQKTKPLLKRLEYSADVQFAKSDNLIPTTSNIGPYVKWFLETTHDLISL